LKKFEKGQFKYSDHLVLEQNFYNSGKKGPNYQMQIAQNTSFPSSND